MTLQRVLPSAAPMTQQPALDLAVWKQLSQLARWAPTPHNTQPFRIRPRSPTQADVVALPERFLTMEDPGNRYCSASAGILAVALEKAAQHLGHVLTCVPTMDFDPASMSRATAPVTVASVTITGHCRGVQALGGLHWIAGEQAEEHLGVGVIRRDLDGLERDHADPRVFQLARDQIRQIALDLVGHLEGAIGQG